MGTRFLVGTADITAIRYFKPLFDNMGAIHVGRIYDAGNWAVLAETEPFGTVCGVSYTGWVTIPLKRPFRTSQYAAYVAAVDNLLFHGRTPNAITYPVNK